jgi:multiple sugar transport system permease protein
MSTSSTRERASVSPGPAPGSASRRRSGRGSKRRRDLVAATGFLAPAVVAALLLRIWPTVRALWDSLHSTPLGVAPAHFVGLDQYRDLFTDPGFINTLKVTVIFAVIINPLQILVAIALAMLLNQRLRGGGLMRTLVFLPVAIPQSVSAVIWAVAFRPDGPLNGVLGLVGLDGLRFITSPAQALPSLMIVVSWIGVGYWMMFLIAGLKEISPSLYDAASLDGAGAWGRFRYVTIPQLRRQIMFVLVADTISNLLVFAPVAILTRGGPDGHTDLIMYDVFERAYISGDVGGAAAATTVLVVIALAIVVVQFRLLGRED